MRRAAYVGASVAASAAVVLRAFHERPNFYSATVYLGQSTACRMILLNMLLITLGSSIYGLQRLLYGPLRAIEIEQLWDKAWYAITETALAMTTFRDEVGGYFFVMFMTLLAGKVWGWIGEGRVETLEQQPPANPKTFHARLIASLFLSEAFDLLMLRYCARTILDQNPPRAGMMVMFVFEFAILAINSSSTLARYGLALQERLVIHNQTKVKVEERKEEIRAQREEARRLAIANAAHGHTVPPLEPVTDDDVDENEIDVPGWQEKGKFILFLDLLTDFLKLVFYMGFFWILIVFAGIPIHMFRDLYITSRSFLKRINDYLKYRNATRDMNTRYPDATAQELERDGTCIICREDMRPWQEPHAQPHTPGRQRSPPDERRRPKKLPCGHILHVGCLRSWLERQQVCPTCRRSVLAAPPTSAANANQQQGQEGDADDLQRPGHHHGRDGDQRQQQGRDPNRPLNGVDGIRARTFNLGGVRLTFATGNARQVRNALDQMRNTNDTNGQSNAGSLGAAVDSSRNNQGGSASAASMQEQLRLLEQNIVTEINQLNATREQLGTVRALESELARLRNVQANPEQHAGGSMAAIPLPQQFRGVTPASAATPMPPPSIALPPASAAPLQQQVFGAAAQQAPLNGGSSALPQGLTLPEGWSMLPLQRMGPTTPPPNGAREPLSVVPQAPFVQPPRPSSVPAQGHTQAPLRTTPIETSQAAADSQSTSAAPSAHEPASAQITAQQPVLHNAAPTANGVHHTEDTEPALVTGLPDWSNSGGASSHGPSRQEREASSEAADGQQGNGSAREEKGKGRAATVEEIPDPEA